ncbi:Uncharacterized protein SCF082_LOCUS12206 [Durusdinium trenchii]|uniref:Uncharacterized protein n=1 Tax=Durusdinium trenchii TaxID=1381693 RepID=A0ABP0JI88_9DINO
MAVIGESCASLTPYGVGATLAQLGSGGVPNDKKPKRPIRIYGLGYTSAFERPATGQTIPPGSPGPRMASSHSAPSIRSDSESSRPPSSLSKTQLYWSPMTSHTFWEFDQLRSVRSPVREREVGRIARIMGQSSLSSVPRDTPMGVLKNPYYRRRGLVHGEV